MMKKMICWVPFLLLFVLFSGCAMSSAAVDTANGAMPLSSWDFDSDGMIKLDGEWEFYWDRLIMPGQFSAEQPTGFYHVPGYWTNYDGLSLPSSGQATYRLTVQTDGAHRLFGIRTPELYTQYALWINGRLIAANGLTESRPVTYLNPDDYFFYCDSDTLEIVLQVKNSSHIYGGIGQSLLLGTPEQLISHADILLAMGLLLFFLCIIAAIYHLTIYLFKRTEPEYLAFFALCLTAGIRTLFSNDTLIMRIFPSMPFIVGSKIATLTVPLCVISALLFIYLQFKENFSKTAFISISAVHSLYALLVVFTSTPVYSAVFIYYLIAVALSIFYGLYLSILFMVKKRDNAAYFLAAYLFLFLGAGIDMLNFLQIVQTGYLFSFAIFLSILIYAVMLIRRYVASLRRTEQISAELKLMLDRVMHTETAFLQAQIKPHFIYNALNTIAQCCDTDSKKAGRLILSFSKYLRGTLDFENLSGIITLKKEIELVGAYTELEKARFEDIRIEYAFDDPLPDIQIPPLTLQPLVENAIKHGLRKKGTGGLITVRIEQRKEGVFFSVKDDGIGMTEQQLESLLRIPAAGAGIGLYNIHTRLERLYGQGLCIQSNFGVGTTISFSIPYRGD